MELGWETREGVGGGHILFQHRGEVCGGGRRGRGKIIYTRKFSFTRFSAGICLKSGDKGRVVVVVVRGAKPSRVFDWQLARKGGILQYRRKKSRLLIFFGGVFKEDRRTNTCSDFSGRFQCFGQGYCFGSFIQAKLRR